MKKILSAILCLLVCAQAFGVGSISSEAEETKEMFFDSFDYKNLTVLVKETDEHHRILR